MGYSDVYVKKQVLTAVMIQDNTLEFMTCVILLQSID